MRKFAFIFLMVFNITGACALFPARSTISVSDIIVKPKIVKLDDIVKQEVQTKFPWVTDRLYTIIAKESAKYDAVNPMLVASLIWKESRGKAHATGPIRRVPYMRIDGSYYYKTVRARGYMQVMPFHYKGGKENLYIPSINIKEGVEELAACYKIFESDIGALKCYNAGPRHKLYKNWPYVREITRNYNGISKKVMDRVIVYINSGYEVI